MNKNLQRLLPVCLLAFGGLGFTAPAFARVVDKIVAIVNDQLVTLTDTEKFRKRLSSQGLVDDALLRLTEPEILKKDRNALLTHLIDEKLIDSEVKRKGMEVTIERVEQEIRTIAKGNNISRNQLKDALSAKGVTISQYQDFIKTSLERQSLIEREVTSKIRISDEDITSYYLSTKGPTGAQTFEYNLAHILFTPKTGGPEGALVRARAVEEKLKAGESFEKVAEQFSEDPNFSKGGQFGVLRADEMSKEFQDALAKAQTGDVTEPVKSPQGYHIIKVIKRTLIADPMLDEQRESIRGVIYAREFKKQFRVWLNQRRDEAFIRINGY